MRWKQDGPDYHVGSQTLLPNGSARAPGGMVVWLHNNTWYAYFWARGVEKERLFKYLKSAKNWVEKLMTEAKRT